MISNTFILLCSGCSVKADTVKLKVFSAYLVEVILQHCFLILQLVKVCMNYPKRYKGLAAQGVVKSLSSIK